MDHTSLLNAFKDIFPKFNIISYKKLDAHSLEINIEQFAVKNLIWTWYNPTSWKLETK